MKRPDVSKETLNGVLYIYPSVALSDPSKKINRDGTQKEYWSGHLMNGVDRRERERWVKKCMGLETVHWNAY